MRWPSTSIRSAYGGGILSARYDATNFGIGRPRGAKHQGMAVNWLWGRLGKWWLRAYFQVIDREIARFLATVPADQLADVSRTHEDNLYVARSHDPKLARRFVDLKRSYERMEAAGENLLAFAAKLDQHRAEIELAATDPSPAAVRNRANRAAYLRNRATTS